MKDRFPQTIVEALNTWQLFRIFGYPAESIYLNLPYDEEEKKVHIRILIKHFGRSAEVHIASASEVLSVDESEIIQKEIASSWTKACGEYVLLENDEKMELFDSSAAKRDSIFIIAKLLDSGLGANPEQIARMSKFSLKIDND